MFRRRTAAFDERLFDVMRGDKFIDRRSDRPRHGHRLHDVIPGVGQRLPSAGSAVTATNATPVAVRRNTTHSFGAPDVRFSR